MSRVQCSLEVKKMAEGKEVKEGKVFAILAYLSILCLIPLLFKKDNKFALHHGKQGLVLFIAEVALWVVGWILIIIPVLGWLVLVLAWPILGILSLIGIIQAVMGAYWKCPVVFGISEKIKI